MSDERDVTRDPNLPNDRQPRARMEREIQASIDGLDELAMDQDTDPRPGFVGRLVNALTWRRGRSLRSLLPCVVVVDFEDAFDATPEGEKAGEEWLKQLDGDIEETVVLAPRGLDLYYVRQGRESLEILSLTDGRK